jgi:hypothetical protein
MDDCHFSYIEKLKKKKTKEKPLLEAGTSSHGLVITGYCPLLDFETKPSVSVFFFFLFFWGLMY